MQVFSRARAVANSFFAQLLAKVPRARHQSGPGVFSPATQESADLSMLRDVAIIAAAKRVLLRTVEDSAPSVDIASLGDFLQLDLGAEKREFGGAAFFAMDGRCLRVEPRLFAGTTRSTFLSPRVIAEKALELGATGVIAFHNHPVGTAHPSNADREHHLILRTALLMFEITLLDEFVITHDGLFSFKESGLLEEGLQREQASRSPSPATGPNAWIHSESGAMASLVRALIASQGEAIDFSGCSPLRLEAIRELAWRIGGDLDEVQTALRSAISTMQSVALTQAIDVNASLRIGLMDLGWQAEQARRIRCGSDQAANGSARRPMSEPLRYVDEPHIPRGDAQRSTGR